MNTVQEIKSDIKRALLSQQNKIVIPHYNAAVLFEQVLEENPLIAVQIDRVSTTATFGRLVVYVDYNGDELPQHVSRVNNEREFEQALHKSIGKYASRALIISPASVNVEQLYHNFYTAYGGYYSNLTKMAFEQKRGGRGAETWNTFTFTYRIGRLRLGVMERLVDEKAAAIAKQLFLPSMSSQVKAYVAHNYLAVNVEYCNNKSATPLERSYLQSAYGALINNRCVCQGYSEAYKRLLDEAKIACNVICGKIRGSKENHAWNVVSFNGKNYYHVDVTWDAGKDKPRFDYYGLNDVQMSKDRIWTRPSNILCSGGEDILNAARRDISLRKEQYVAQGIAKKYLGL